ncbi:hypothetical protein [Streptomyces sp. NPDC048277]|uniref:hypothetical protein n=1 Tax=Streptomyces sp. NPDC048277 TaxID=3155027 RepID=UPI0033D3EE8A
MRSRTERELTTGQLTASVREAFTPAPRRRRARHQVRLHLITIVEGTPRGCRAARRVAALRFSRRGPAAAVRSPRRATGATR